MTNPGIDLSLHSASKYDKGRPRWVQAIWFVAMSVFFVKWWFPSRLRATVLRFFGARVSPNVYIRHGVRIQWPWKLTVGRNTWIGVGAWILNLDEVSIGANVCISQDAMILTGSHDRRDVAFEHKNSPITIEDGVWICARSMILPGSFVGANSIVSAGAIFSGKVGPGEVVGH